MCTFNVGPFTLALRYLFACMLCLCVFDGSRAQRNKQANDYQHQTRTRTHDGILIRTSTPLTTCGMDSNMRFGTQEHTFHLLRLAFYALGMHRKQVDLDLCMRCRSPRFGCWLHSDKIHLEDFRSRGIVGRWCGLHARPQTGDQSHVAGLV